MTGDNDASQQDAGVLVMPNTGAVRYSSFLSSSFPPSTFPVKYGEYPIQDQRSIAG